MISTTLLFLMDPGESLINEDTNPKKTKEKKKTRKTFMTPQHHDISSSHPTLVLSCLLVVGQLVLDLAED